MLFRSDSIKYSIDILKRHKIYITKRSVNVKKEFEKYRWDEKNPNQPVGTNDHSIAGVRYIALNLLVPNNTGRFSIM